MINSDSYVKDFISYFFRMMAVNIRCNRDDRTYITGSEASHRMHCWHVITYIYH